MNPTRRQLLKALGLGALTSLVPRGLRVRADAGAPARIVFFIQPHGHVPSSWTMPIPDAPSDRFAQRSLVGLSETSFSEVLRPLYGFRDRLQVVEGLSHTTVLADLAEVQAHGGDDNNHSLAVAGLLTLSRALQRPDLPCTGGARSFDQELALRTGAPGRFSSRVYGAPYVPNASVAPFSFIDAGKPTPVVGDPQTAFADLMGFVKPTTGSAGAAPSRSDRVRALRASVLDGVAQEFEALAPRLSAADRQKLGAHHTLVRELELSVGSQQPASCALELDASGETFTSFARLMRMALACDLTRVITYVAPVPQCPEFGYPAEAHVHATYAHASVRGNTSCGQTYDPLAERAMTDLSVWYAKQFATLLHELDSVQEGGGTLLDSTLVVWLTELGTPTHQHHDAFTLIAGGSKLSLDTGRYLRYPRTLQNPLKDGASIGPAQSRLFVSLLRAMGQSDEGFGMASALGAGGEVLSLGGVLSELHKSV